MLTGNPSLRRGIRFPPPLDAVAEAQVQADAEGTAGFTVGDKLAGISLVGNTVGRDQV